MIDIPVQVQNLFKRESVRKNFRVHFPNGEHTDLTNENIVYESVQFSESACSMDTFKFGLSERSQIKFECVGVPNIFGKTIECGIEIDLSSLSSADITAVQNYNGDGTYVSAGNSDIGFPFYHVPYGVFIVDSCPRSHGAMQHRKVIAYSDSAGSGENLTNFLRTTHPFSRFTFTQKALNALLFNDATGFINTPATLSESTSGLGDRLPLCDSNGVKYFVECTDSGTVGNANWSCTFGDSTVREFAYADYTQNYEANQELGIKVAQALDTLGLSLIYGSDRRQRYESNEEALRAFYPYLFCPSFRVIVNTSSGSGTDEKGMDYNIPLLSNQLTPIFKNNNEIEASGFPFPYIRYDFGAVTNIPATLNFKVAQVDNPTTSAINFTVTTTPFTQTFNSFGFLSTNSTDTRMSLTISPTLTTQGYFHTTMTDSEKGYTYSNAVSVVKLQNSILELYGQFGRQGRTGNFEKFQLDEDNPIAINPRQYSDLWWDDYTINDIGTVIFSINGGNTVCRYKFGNGVSEYDMTDNEYLRKLVPSNSETEDDIVSSVKEFLLENFVPQLSAINFTPTDMTMIGLPYLEAGDYLAIDDADGGTVYTYMLTRDCDGIQVLFDTVESNGGDIIRGD